MRQTFGQNEAEQILREAVRRDEERRATSGQIASSVPLAVPTDRLREMAQELGVSPEVLDSVLRDREQQLQTQRKEASEQELKAEFIRERRAGFLPHLYSYVGVIGFLFLIWLMTTPGGYPWFLWPMLGWGLGMYFHGIYAVPTRGTLFDAEYSKWKEGRQRRAEKQARRKAKEDAEKARTDAEAELDEL